MLLRPWEVLGGGYPVSQSVVTGVKHEASTRRVHALQNDLGVDPYFLADAVVKACELARESHVGTETRHVHLSQCLTTAAVESMMVPSMSNRRPSKVRVSGGAEKAGVVGVTLPMLM